MWVATAGRRLKRVESVRFGAMTLPDDTDLEDVTFDELESVDQYEATFTGTLDGEEIVLTYTLESAIGADEETTVYTPGDEELEYVVVQPDSYEFQTDDRETVRFAGSDDESRDLAFVYLIADAEDSEANQVDLTVTADPG